MEETERRRKKQIAHNQAQGIEPRTIQKAVADIMEGAVPRSSGKRDEKREAAESKAEYRTMTPAQLNKTLKALEQQMYEHARNLEFEEAARLRDRIQGIKRQVGLALPSESAA